MKIGLCGTMSVGKTTLVKALKKLPEFDMLCCGFPCQPFSCSGNKKGFKDKRGGMIFKLLDLCKLYKPQTIILENVSNLLTLVKGKIISKIQNIFEEIGYSISYRRLNSIDFGAAGAKFFEGIFGKGDLRDPRGGWGGMLRNLEMGTS